MLTPDAMRQLREAYNPHTPVTEQDVLASLGNPAVDEIIDTALEMLKSTDRNLRVLSLRVLGQQSGAKAMQGILTGLTDSQRRVRTVAIKCSANFHDHPAITDCLKAIVGDDNEKRKIRNHALSALTASIGPLMGTLSAGDVAALQALAQVEANRSQILLGLLRLDLSDHVEGLLREFVQVGSKEEAVLATRALCGYRVVNLGDFGPEGAVQKHIRATCEIAAGQVWYWVKRDDYPALRAGQVPPMV